MSNICRPFYLYNDFLPPSKKMEAEWKIFGYYDDLSVGNPITLPDKAMDFEALWNIHMDQNEQLCGSYSKQIVFGFRNKKDDIFWEDAGKYPFLFFSMLQISRDKTLEFTNAEFLEKFEKENTQNDYKVITYTAVDYSDIIVVLLCKNYKVGETIIEDLHLIKDRKLLSGPTWDISYGYSFGAVNRDLIKSDKDLEKFEGNVSDVQIYVIGKKLDKIIITFEKMLELIEQNGCGEYIDGISRSSLMGCNDQKIEIEELPWKLFLTFYRESTGIFNHTNKDYKANIVGVTTIIGKLADNNGIKQYVPMGSTKFDDGHRKKNMDGRQGREEYKNDTSDENESKSPILCESMIQRCQKLLFKVDKTELNNIRRYYVRILNSLGKFEVSPIHDYLFQTTICQLRMIMDMAEQAINDLGKLKSLKEKLDHGNGNNKTKIGQIEEIVQGIENTFKSSSYDFIREFSIYVQNSERTDRQFTQAPDLDVVIYNTPVKLNAFYNAFIYYMKEYLNTLSVNTVRKHEYEFLVYPGATDFVKLRERFQGISETKRMFLIELPEIETYHPKELMIILGHEVAHNVGSEIRNRELRTDKTRTILAYLYTKYIRISMYKYDKQSNREKHLQYLYDENKWEEITKSVKREIEDIERMHFEQYSWISELSEKGEVIKKKVIGRKDHKEFVMMRFEDVITHLADMNKLEIWNTISSEEYYYWLCDSEGTARDKKKELQNMISNWGYEFTGHTTSAKKCSYNNVMELLFYLYRECIADLICIKTFEVSFCEYIELMVRELVYQGEKSFEDIDRYAMRGALVYICMKKKNGFFWSSSESDNLTGDDEIVSCGFRKLKERIYQLVNLCFGRNEITISKFFESMQSFIEKNHKTIETIPIEIFVADSFVMKHIAEYLCKCVEFLQPQIYRLDKENCNQKLEKLRFMYKLFRDSGNNTDIQTLVGNMYRCIEEYYKELQKKNEVH